MIGTSIDNWKRIVIGVPNSRLQQQGYNRNSKREILEEFEIGSNSKMGGIQRQPSTSGFQKRIEQMLRQAYEGNVLPGIFLDKQRRQITPSIPVH
jgi:hypothetical protein